VTEDGRQRSEKPLKNRLDVLLNRKHPKDLFFDYIYIKIVECGRYSVKDDPLPTHKPDKGIADKFADFLCLI
jgi:hypothetical protein